MYYEVFPFGKYKGVKLKELPSTYIVLALEKFELPDELYGELKMILFGRFKVFSLTKLVSEREAGNLIYDLISKYENENE